jgi:hypothetical protein
MSWQATKAVWEHTKQTGYGKLLMLALAEFADADGRCWPSIETLAERIDVADRSVKRLIAQAESDGELSVCRNAGRGNTNEYVILFAAKGDASVTINELEKGDTPVRKGDTSVTKGDTPVRKGDTPVTQNHQEPSNNHQEPSKEPVRKRQPKKEPVFEIPETLNNERFLVAWGDYVTHRREIKKPLTSLAAKKQLKQLEEWGQDRAVVAINHSIAKGWQSIYEPKNFDMHHNGSHPNNGTAVHHSLKTREIKQVQGEF